MWPFTKLKLSHSSRPFISIRMEAVGGQGANSAGKILAEAAVLGMNYTGNHFSSFGSEKRGSPVRSFVRFSPALRPVRTASFIKNPDLLIIFHESLLQSHPEILAGSTQQTDIILNTSKSPQSIQVPRDIQFRKIMTLDATSISNKYKCGLNAVLLGAAAEACPEIDKTVLMNTLNKFFSNLPEKARENNLKGFESAVTHLNVKPYKQLQSSLEPKSSPLPEMGWLNAPLGGVIVNPGNSILKDHSASRRGVAPLFTKEICFNCGFCDMVCPDFCFVWKIDRYDEKKPELQGIDYQYCKGCQKCITVCPVEALTPSLESEIPEENKKNILYPHLNMTTVVSQWKQMDWAKYTEELSKEGQMLSLQTELLDPQSYLRPEFSESLLEKIKKDSSNE